MLRCYGSTSGDGGNLIGCLSRTSSSSRHRSIPAALSLRVGGPLLGERRGNSSHSDQIGESTTGSKLLHFKPWVWF